MVPSLDALIELVYPEVNHLDQKPDGWLCERAILTPKNAAVAKINTIILASIPTAGIAFLYFEFSTIAI